jgi:hypothetical protein
MDWIKKPIYASIEAQTINLNGINHWKNPEEKGVERFKIYVKNTKIVCIKLDYIFRFR